MAQKSPHTHRMAAPISWSANGGNVIPGVCPYTEYQGLVEKMLIVMASTHMATLVATSAAAWETSGIRRMNGGEGMNCSQNSTPARKNVACISQMCTIWLFWARSNMTGMCQNTITK